METIYKYQLPAADDAGVEMQAGAEILHIGVQGDIPMIWALVDSEARMEVRKFVTYGTGHEVDCDPSGLKFIGTWMMAGGSLVFHTFEKIGS